MQFFIFIYLRSIECQKYMPLIDLQTMYDIRMQFCRSVSNY
jgi:hypothetical protein